LAKWCVGALGGRSVDQLIITSQLDGSEMLNSSPHPLYVRKGTPVPLVQ